jgi:type II secretory pathway component PulM
MTFLRSLTPLGIRLLVGAVLLLLVAGFLTLQSCQTARTAKTERRLAENQTEAALESGADAVGTVGAVGATEVQIDLITRENERVIRTAPGADAPVDPAVHAAGTASLCRRAAYRGSEQCLQFAPAR